MTVAPRKGKSPRLPSFGRVPRPASNSGQPAYDPPGMKRSTKVTLAMAGAATLGLYMATRDPNCPKPDPANPQAQQQPCRSSGTGGHSRGLFHFSSGSATSTSGGAQTATARGGFGATGSSIGSHGAAS